MVIKDSKKRIIKVKKISNQSWGRAKVSLRAKVVLVQKSCRAKMSTSAKFMLVRNCPSCRSDAVHKFPRAEVTIRAKKFPRAKMAPNQFFMYKQIEQLTSVTL